MLLLEGSHLTGLRAVRVDPPAQVAAAACAMLEAGKASAVFGWPEKLFVRIRENPKYALFSR